MFLVIEVSNVRKVNLFSFLSKRVGMGIMFTRCFVVVLRKDAVIMVGIDVSE